MISLQRRSRSATSGAPTSRETSKHGYVHVDRLRRPRRVQGKCTSCPRCVIHGPGRVRERETRSRRRPSPPVLVAELLAEGERMPVYVHVIDHPDARVLVDTGMTQLHPAVADMDPRLIPLSTQADFDLASIDVVVNTHLHFDTAAATISS